jgi:hypothetical protein
MWWWLDRGHQGPRGIGSGCEIHSARKGDTRCGALGLRGEMATPMRQGVWCLLPVVLNTVPITAPFIPIHRPLPEG